MLMIITLVFVVAAFFGSKLFKSIMADKPTSKVFAATHGILVGIGLISLFVYISFTDDWVPVIPIIVFLFAGLFGCILFVRDIQDNPGPKWLAILHPIFSTAGLLILIFLAFFY